MISPILNGAPGFILLAIVVALGAYLRGVYAAANDLHEKIIIGGQAAWPLKKDYTQTRLANLQAVENRLKRITFHIFLFSIIVAVRLILFAVTVIPTFSVRGDNTLLLILYWWDLLTMIALTVGLCFMWRAHSQTACIERDCVKKMRTAYNQNTQN
jgi:hypothetical protein